MTTIADYSNLSVRLPDALYGAAQALAARQRRLARDVHTDSVRTLLAARKRGEEVRYLPSTKDAKQRTIWLEKPVCEEAKAAAEEDRVSKTVLFLTALTLFCHHEGALVAA